MALCPGSAVAWTAFALCAMVASGNLLISEDFDGVQRAHFADTTIRSTLGVSGRAGYFPGREQPKISSSAIAAEAFQGVTISCWLRPSADVISGWASGYDVIALQALGIAISYTHETRQPVGEEILLFQNDFEQRQDGSLV